MVMNLFSEYGCVGIQPESVRLEFFKGGFLMVTAHAFSRPLQLLEKNRVDKFTTLRYTNVYFNFNIKC